MIPLLPILLTVALGSVADPEVVPVRVTVTGTGDETAIKNAYVSLYAPEAAWHRPSAETIARNGTATFRVRPGEYQILAGADGYQAGIQRISVSASWGGSVIVELLPNFLVSGTVTDRFGNPIRDARVSQVRIRLSDLALQQLGRAWVTSTDANGWWTLPMPTEWKLPISFEAPGFAPAWYVSRPEELPASAEIVLQQGGGLHLTLDRPDPEMIVTLAAVEATPGNKIPPDAQMQLWAKRASKTTLKWDSLPAGEYRLIAASRDTEGLFSSVLAVVRIDPAVATELRIKLPPAARPRALTTLFVKGKSAREFPGVQAWKHSGGPKLIPSAVEQASGGTLIHIGATAAVLFATTPDQLIIPSAAIAAERPSPAATYDRGEATLRVIVTDASVRLPSSGMAFFGDCAQNRRFSLPVAVAKDGAVTVHAPSMCRTLTLQFPPLEAVVIPLLLKRGETKWLGEFRVAAGAEAEVHVRRNPSGSAVRGAVVRARADVEDRDVIVAEVIADDTGSAVLTGLPADEDLVIEAQERGYETVSARVRIGPADRIVIDSLSISDPATLTVSPSLSARFREHYPKATIASVVLQPETGRNDTERTSRSDSLDEHGSTTFHDLQPGRWHLRVVVEAEESGQPIDAADIDVAAGEVRRVTPEIEPLMFEGRLVAHGSGTRWSVAIADPPGRSAIRRYFQVRPDRTFTAILPRRGIYEVRLRSDEKGSSDLEIGDVDFRDPTRAIEIVVPGGALLVKVRDRGEPASEIPVTLTMRRDSQSGGVKEIVRRAKTDTSGTTRFLTLPEGPWIARVSTADRRVAEKVSVVERDMESQVELDLEAASALRGVVRDGAGRPAIQANVDCLFMSPAGPVSRRAETGDDGRYSLDLPAIPPQTLRCAVTTPGGLVGAYLARPAETVDFTLPVATASLAIPDWGERLPRNDLWMLSPDGRIVSLTWIGGKIGKLWTPLVIPHFPAGTWRLVRADTVERWTMLASGVSASAETLTEVRLQPGDRRELRVYADRNSGQ